MANPLSIYSGPADLALYDASNDHLHLGYTSEATFTGEAQVHDIMDGNQVQYTTLHKAECNLLQSNQTMLDDIVARRATKQTLYAIFRECLIKMANVYPALGLSRSMKPGEGHVLKLTAQTAIESDITITENLLGEDGNMDTDTNTDGVSDGWVASAAGTSRATSFLGAGYGSHQQVEFDGAGQYFRSDVIELPFESPRRLTVSATFYNTEPTGTNDIYLGFQLLDASDSVISTSQSTVTLTALTAGRFSHSALVSPSEPVYGVRFLIAYNSDSFVFRLDNAQMELGDLTDYKEV